MSLGTAPHLLPLPDPSQPFGAGGLQGRAAGPGTWSLGFLGGRMWAAPADYALRLRQAPCESATHQELR